VLSLSLSLPALAAGEDDIIYIHTTKDLCALSDSCAYDAWMVCPPPLKVPLKLAMGSKSTPRREMSAGRRTVLPRDQAS